MSISAKKYPSFKRVLKSRRFWISIIITSIFLVISFYHLEMDKLRSAFRNANYIYIIPAIAVYFLAMLVRGFRWRTLLKPVKDVSGIRLTPVVIIGYMANNLLPFRLGEFVRAYVVGRKEGISKSASLATIVVERIFDGLTMLLFLAIVAAFFEFPGWSKQIIRITSVVFIGFFLFCLLIILRRAWFEKVMVRFIGYAPERFRPLLTNLCGSFIEGLAVLRSVRDVFTVLLWSLLVWVIEGSMFYITLEAFRPVLPAEYVMPFFGPLMAVAIVNLGIMVPSSPGYVGPFEFFCIKTLLLFGVPEETGASYTILLHAAQFVPITIAGLIFLAREGIQFGEIRKEL